MTDSEFAYAEKERKAFERSGGPAFPFSPTQHSIEGITIRDYFAGHAVAGLLAFGPPDIAGQMSPADAAESAYRVADAMIAARKGGSS